MTHKLLMTAAVVALALTPSIGNGTAQADGGGFHGGGSTGGAFHGGGVHHRAFAGGRGFLGTGFGYGSFVGDTEPDTVVEAPSVYPIPGPAPAVAKDRPPCQETTVGVIIMRGTSCSHGTQ
jgi:hypothetical protein